MKRGLASPFVHSALPMTRRRRLQRRLAGPLALHLGLSQMPLDLGRQPLVARQAEQKVHFMALAPRHQALAGETGIGAHHNADPRPARPDLADDPIQLRFGARRAVDVGAPQLGRQQVPPAGHVQRQIAVVVVVAVEEPPLLMAVQRIVRRVEVEHDLARRPSMRLDEQVHEQLLDRRLVVADLVVLRRLRTAQLKTIQRALARHRRTVRTLGLMLAQQHRQQPIVPQMVVVDEVFVAQRQAEHPLADQRADLVLDQIGIAMVLEAPRKPIHQPDRPVGRSQQQPPGIRRERSAIERRLDPAAFNRCKSEQI